MRKYYQNIDVYKIFLAILVICIHTNPLQDISEMASYILSGCLARIAVPLFFCFSGFLFGQCVTSNKMIFSYALKYIKKNLWVYIKWSFLYFPIMVLEYYINGKTFLLSLFLEIRDSIFIGSYFHLWYFPALILSILLITILFYFKINKGLIFIFSLIIYLTGVLISTYKIYNINIFTRNGLFFGFLFCSMGFYFSKKNVIENRYKINIIGITFSILFLLVEGLIVKYVFKSANSDMYFSLVLICYFVIKIILYNRPIKLIKKNFHFKEFSLFLYCFHPFPLLIWETSYKILSLRSNSILRFSFVMIVTLIMWKIKNDFLKFRRKIHEK